MLVFTGFVCVYAPTWLWGKGPTAQTLHTVDVLFVLCCFVYLMEHMRIKGLENFCRCLNWSSSFHLSL